MIIKIIRILFSIFYKEKYLHGYFFDEKKLGWYWAYKGVYNKIFDIHARKVPWPINRNTIVSGADRIQFDLSSINVFQSPGCYWQAHDARIIIGKKCYVAPNVGIITTNHDPKNPDKHLQGKDIVIGDHCWIGMNSVILPGVVLGPYTIVGAGAIVTKSFQSGHCIIGGVPAHIIKES